MLWKLLIFPCFLLDLPFYLFIFKFLVERRYKLIKEVGDGTFGSVWRAINKQTGEVVSVVSLICHMQSQIMCVLLKSLFKITGCNQENEEEILLLGGVCKSERGQGDCMWLISYNS